MFHEISSTWINNTPSAGINEYAIIQLDAATPRRLFLSCIYMIRNISDTYLSAFAPLSSLDIRRTNDLS